jgi:ABC-type multidrug transport system permease subunit
MTFIWILLGIVYLLCLIFLGVTTIRKGHYVLFVIGFFLPILWILGALIRPTARAAERFAATA